MRLPVTGLACLPDINGTPVDVADVPSGVKLDPAVPGLVEALYQSSGGAIALITGRSIADADRLFPKNDGPSPVNTVSKVGPGPTVVGWAFLQVSAVLAWLERGRPGPKRCQGTS